MTNSAVRVGLWAALVISVGCAQPTAFGDYELPPEDVSLDPNRLATGALLFGCGVWGPAGKPAEAYVLADIVFGPLAGDPMDRPAARHTDTARDRGGRVLYEFNFPGFRMYAAPDRVPPVVSAIPGAAAFTVPDPSRFDFRVSVLTSGGTTSALLGFFEALGGRVRLAVQQGFFGDLPNRSIPTLRADLRVQVVQNDVQLCPTTLRQGRSESRGLGRLGQW